MYIVADNHRTWILLIAIKISIYRTIGRTMDSSVVQFSQQGMPILLAMHLNRRAVSALRYFVEPLNQYDLNVRKARRSKAPSTHTNTNTGNNYLRTSTHIHTHIQLKLLLYRRHGCVNMSAQIHGSAKQKNWNPITVVHWSCGHLHTDIYIYIYTGGTCTGVHRNLCTYVCLDHMVHVLIGPHK